MTALIDSKEMRCSIELCSTPFSLYYFKPSSFKNMNADAISEIKLIVRALSSIYSSCSHYIPDGATDYVKEKTQDILDLSRRSGYRVLVLNAPFSALGVFMFSKRFSVVDNIFGGQDDGYYSIASTGTRNLAMKCEWEMMNKRGRMR